MTPYERVTAWQLAHRLVLETYRVTADFPSAERFELTRQCRRAAFSVAANIAEGAAKRGKAEFRRYLDIALGSLSEVQYALLVARDLEMLSAEEWKRVDALRDETGRVLWGLYRAMGGADAARKRSS